MGIHSEILDKIAVLAIAFCGFLAAFAWNDVIQAIIKDFFGPIPPPSAMIWYAVIMTVIAGVVTVCLGNLAKRAKRREL